MNIPNFIDSLKWYRDDYFHARIRDDKERKELAELFDLFAQNQRLDKQLALGYLEQGLRLAQSDSGHPYWELMFEYWHYTLTAPSIGDVDSAVRLFMKANQVDYRECPILGRVYAMMIDAYVWDDPISYATEIRQAIDYTLEHIPIEKNTFQRMMLAQSRLHYELQEPEIVLESATVLLEYSQDYAPDTINAHLYLAQAHMTLQEYDDAYANARLAHDVAIANKFADFQRAALTVQAAVFAHQRDWGNADVVRFQMRELDWRGAKWLDLSFDAELEYWRKREGLWAKFVVLRFSKQILDYYRRQDQFYWICRARFDLISAMLDVPSWLRWAYRLLLDIPTLKQQVQEAQEAANHLKRSDWYLDRLSKIAHPFMD
ncbi:MAG: hypothetical protein Phog2KO_28380 [Phototrophicaceae bacterium]